MHTNSVSLQRDGGRLHVGSLLSLTHFFITFATSPDAAKCIGCVSFECLTQM